MAVCIYVCLAVSLIDFSFDWQLQIKIHYHSRCLSRTADICQALQIFVTHCKYFRCVAVISHTIQMVLMSRIVNIKDLMFCLKVFT